MVTCFPFDLMTAIPGDVVGGAYPWQDYVLPDIPPIVGDQFIAFTVPSVGSTSEIVIAEGTTDGGLRVTGYSKVQPSVPIGDGTRAYYIYLRFESPVPFVLDQPLGLKVYVKVTSPIAQFEMLGGGPGYVEPTILEDGTSQLLVFINCFCSAAGPLDILVSVDGASASGPFWTSFTACTELTDGA